MTKPGLLLITACVFAVSANFTGAFAASDTASQQTMPMHNSMTTGQKKAMPMPMDHSKMVMPGKDVKLPKEPGQGGFATIAEIVDMLVEDPKTDWSKVNIDRLREHLVDMDEVTLRAKSQTTVEEDKIVFTVTGTGRTRQAIQAMVLPHAGVLSSKPQWRAEGKLTENGATLTIYTSDPQRLKMLEALGFFGVMATGVHHQPHHLAMAKGM